jgi:drug/metabolite transporter (DMT)-like permease
MPYLGEIFALITAIWWTGSSMAFTAATVRVGSVYVNVMRMILATLILLPIGLVAGGLQNVKGDQLLYLSLSGFVGFVFGDSFLFKAFETIGARISMVIMAFAPALTALLAYIFLGETLSFLGFLGMIITLFAIGMVVLDRNGSKKSRHLSPAGVLWAFLATLGQAGGYILTKAAFNCGAIGGIEATFIRVLAGTILIVPLNYFLGYFRHPIRVFREKPEAMKYTVLGAVLGPVLGVTFSLLAVSMTKVAIASTLIATTPIFMLPAVRFIYHERLSWQAIVGAILAVGGIVLLFRL